MPLYDYRCLHCGSESEHIFPMSGFPQTVKCECGSRAVKVCNAGGFQPKYGRAGGLQDDHPAWLDKSIEYLQTGAEARREPIESRSDMYNYMKRKGIKFAHEVGEAKAPEEKPISKEVREKAYKAIHKARLKDTAITVN